MMGGPSLKIQPDGSRILALSTPRGCLSVLLLIVSGAFVIVFWSIVFLLQVSIDAPLPGTIAVTAAASCVVFLAVLLDRVVARARGIKVRFVLGEHGVRYEVLHRRRVLQGNRLEAGRLYVAPLELPGRAGRILVPTYALLLIIDEDIPGYSVSAESEPALVLINSSDMNTLEAKLERFCLALGLEISRSVRHTAERGLSAKV